MHPIPLPRWARISIAACCVAIGLASSTVAGSLLVRGLELTEPDGTARVILTAAGVLMILTELVAFFLVALLPAARLYQLRVMGMALLVFEVITIFGTRLVLNQSAEAMTAAQQMRVENLRLAISARSADANRLRANGERQSSSDNAWARHLGSQAIRQASLMEREVEPLREELANLQAAQRPTLPGALGPGLALAHSIAMPILVSTIGLTMFGVAGLMLRRSGQDGDAVRHEEQDGTPATRPAPAPADELPNQAVEVESRNEDLPVPQLEPERPAPSVPQHRTAVPSGTVPAVPPTFSPLNAWHLAAAIPLSVVSAAPAVLASPAVEPLAETPVETVPLPESEPVQADPVQLVDCTITADDDRYQRLRAGVLASQIKPSVRALREAGGGGTDTVRRYLQQLADEGVIAKNGQGYTLAPK